MKLLLISPKNRTVFNFRGDLIRALLSKGHDVVVTGPNHDHIDEINKLGVEFVCVPADKNGTSILGDIRYLSGLCKVIRRTKPHITLGYTIKPVIYGAIAARLFRVKSIISMVTGAGYVFSSKSATGTIAKLLYHIGLLCADTVIFQNPDDMLMFIKNGLVNHDKARVVNGSGVNTGVFVPSALPDQVAFFMLSRIMYSKGVYEYLEAARMVKSHNSDTRFMLLGATEGIQDSLPISILRKYVDDGTVEYYSETDDVRSYYAQCSVFVLPSYSEGTPRTVLEAMAMGRPIITTDAPGCRETVKDGYNGFIVPVRDAAALAHKMQWFIDNPDRISIMGGNSSVYCRSKFDVDKVNQDMIKYLGLGE